MTDEHIVSNDNSAPVSDLHENVSEPADPVQAAPVEKPSNKSLSQDEVNRLVGAVKSETADKVRKEYEAKQAQDPKIDEDYLNTLVDKAFEKRQAEYQKQAQEEQQKEMQAKAEKILEQFIHKVESSKGKYEDFENVVTPLNLSDARVAPMIPFITNVDNTADVLYELGKNPSKFYELQGIMYANQNNPEAVQNWVNDQSKKIAANNYASNIRTPKAPLSQIEPSANASTDNGNLTVEDYRRMPWNK